MSRGNKPNSFRVTINIFWQDYIFISDVPEPLRESFIEFCQARGLYLKIPDIGILG